MSRSLLVVSVIANTVAEAAAIKPSTSRNLRQKTLQPTPLKMKRKMDRKRRKKRKMKMTTKMKEMKRKTSAGRLN